MRLARLIFIILILGVSQIKGQEASSLPVVVPPFTYQPENKEFWLEVVRLYDNKEFSNILKRVDSRLKETKKDSTEQSEAYLAMGQALLGLEAPYSAFIVFTDLVKTRPGTNIAFQALLEIQEVLKSLDLEDDSMVNDLFLDQDLESLPEEVQSLVSYHNGLFNRKMGYEKWAQADFKKIKEKSYWAFKLFYLEAVQDVADQKIDVAIEKFSKLALDITVPESLRADAGHQHARLLFEKGEFGQAYKILKEIKLNPRERGLLLMERAWSKYYTHEYSKALGLLAALEAPIYDSSRPPEVYILKMLIYKDLCYYDAALAVVGEFNQRFGSALQAIKRRKGLRKEAALVQMAGLDRKAGRWVDLINQLRFEKTIFAEKDLKGLSFITPIRRRVEFRLKELYDLLDWLLRDRVRKMGDELIDWQEQISFLDYQTRLDNLRLNKVSPSMLYKPEEIPHMSFDRIYWLFTGEFWLDELESLRVFVESRCGDSTPAGVKK